MFPKRKVIIENLREANLSRRESPVSESVAIRRKALEEDR